jgi:hypothetical protein
VEGRSCLLLAARSVRTPAESNSPSTNVSSRNPHLGVGDGGRRAHAPSAAWSGHPGVEDASAPRRRAGRQAPPESGSLFDLLERCGPLTASSSPHPSHEQSTLATATSLPPPLGVAKTRVTWTCRFSRSRQIFFRGDVACPRLVVLDAVVIPIALGDLFLLVLLLVCGPPSFRGRLVAFEDRLRRERRLRGHKVGALHLEEQGRKSQ